MGGFFDFLRDHWIGIVVFFASLAAVIWLTVWTIQKLCWIFRWGRYSAARAGLGVDADGGGVVRLVGRFLLEIIAEFRNLLALLIFLLFAGVLLYTVGQTMMFSGAVATPGDLDTAVKIEAARIDGISKLIQVIVASLGGLVGSIIGYYFGEAGRKASNAVPAQAPLPPAPVPSQASAGSGGVKPVSPPPQDG